MNIFYVDRNPYRAAQMLCDKHVVKMILESAQILSTVHHRWGTHTSAMYKPTHQHHPSTLWAGDSWLQYNWLRSHFFGLLEEYRFRYGKSHKCDDMKYIFYRSPYNLLNGDFVEPPQCMPEQYRQDDVVEAYRAYYIGEKARFAKWKHSDLPTWWPTNGIATSA